MAEESSVVCPTETKEDEKSLATKFQERGFGSLYEQTVETLNSWLKNNVNVAVTGGPGTGKSSLINAMLNLKEGEKGSAFSDVKEATTSIKKYNHPSNEKIVFSDLPGVGTNTFKRENYLEKVHLERYDFFILVSSERFSENDGWLANEINKMGRQFFFVRTKVDNDIRAEKRSGKINPRTPDEILATIRLDCKESLHESFKSLKQDKSLKFADSPVYLVDNFSPYQYDFGLLLKQLIENAPTSKRETLLFSIKGYREVNSEKKEFLKNRIPKLSMASAVAGAAPIPGVGLCVDVAILIKEVNFYREQLGLTDEDIKKAAEILGLREEELKEEFDMKTFLQNCTKKGIIVLCRQLTVKATSVEIAKYAIPIIGSIVNGTISYKTTSYCLTTILEDIYKASVKVSEKLSSQIEETSLD